MLAANHKIFVINLDSSNLRWQACQKQLDSLPIERERINAIDGRKLNDSARHQHFDTALNLLQYHKTLTVGEMGCYVSHRKVWTKIIEKNLAFALVLTELFATVANIKRWWHCLKLAALPLKRQELSSQLLDKFRLVSYDKVPARTCAQPISHAGAKRLLLSSEKFERPVDIDIQQLWWKNDLIVLGLKPYFFKVNHISPSDIKNIFERKSSKTRHLSKLYRQIYFYINNQRTIKEERFIPC